MDMRQLMQLVESAGTNFVPATPENIARAKAFILAKWRERAIERGDSEPADLSASCKFASLFAALVFGGEVRGNFFHQWVELPGGQTLDLAEDAADVADLHAGLFPDYARSYAIAMRKKPPTKLYKHDPRHMSSRDSRESMASVAPRVNRWVEEFLNKKTDP